MATFFNSIIENILPLAGYMPNATRGQPYDYKITNKTGREIYTEETDFYKGMPIATKADKIVYTSARDIKIWQRDMLP